MVIMTKICCDIFQTGSGTSTNMNANEIISKIASESLSENIHPMTT